MGRRVAEYELLEEGRDWLVALGIRRTVLKQVERAARAHRVPSLEPMIGQTLAGYQTIRVKLTLSRPNVVLILAPCSSSLVL